MAKLVGLIVAILILDIIPVWFINLFEIGVFLKIFLTVILAAMIWFFAERGGAKRGLISR